MSTTIYEGADLTVTQFAGGRDRGVCFQFTLPYDEEGYVQLTRDEVAQLVQALQLALAATPAPEPYKPGVIRPTWGAS